MKSMSELAHEFLRPNLHPGAICIDATLGYGRDAEFFLNQKARRVYAYEVQPELARRTLNRLNHSHLTVFEHSHALMDKDLTALAGTIDAIIFNFGFDPHTLSGICTQKDSSLAAMKQALDLLRHKGRLALVFYPHEQGREEKEALMQELKDRDDLNVLEIRHPFLKSYPILVCVEKIH